MFNPGELRVGNWFCCQHADGETEYVKIKSGADIDNILQGSVNVSPIKITPEILEKVGFKGYYVPGEGWEGIKDNIDCLLPDGYFGYYYKRFEKIFYYLHEVQNLYHSQTGKELFIIF